MTTNLRGAEAARHLAAAVEALRSLEGTLPARLLSLFAAAKSGNEEALRELKKLAEPAVTDTADGREPCTSC